MNTAYFTGGMWRVARRSSAQAAVFGRQALNLLFPPRCLQCDQDLGEDYGSFLLCDQCCLRLGPETWPGCPRCGALWRAESSTSDADCLNCRRAKLHFQQVIPLGSYDGALYEAVLKTKHARHENLARALGGLLVERREPQLRQFRADLIVPIPMHWRRHVRRGVNSPELVAECLAHRLGIPCARGALLRTKNTLPQRDLLPGERFRNLRGAFRAGRADRWRLQGSRVLLVDDILTTGATCSEAAKVLRQAGVAVIAAAVLAKADGPETTGPATS